MYVTRSNTPLALPGDLIKVSLHRFVQSDIQTKLRFMEKVLAVYVEIIFVPFPWIDHLEVARTDYCDW